MTRSSAIQVCNETRDRNDIVCIKMNAISDDKRERIAIIHKYTVDTVVTISTALHSSIRCPALRVILYFSLIGMLLKLRLYLQYERVTGT